MPKSILITGATDGFRLETTKTLASLGHSILLHSRNPEKFEKASGKYSDNDARRFAPPHPDARHPRKSDAIVRVIEETLAALGH